MTKPRRLFTMLAPGLALLVPMAWALEKPSGPVVLTITDQFSRTNQVNTAVFSMERLHKLRPRTVSAKLSGFPVAASFPSAPAGDVRASEGGADRKIVAVALDDYKADILFEEALKHDVISAVSMNAQPMPVREKWQLLMMQPFGNVHPLNSQIDYNHSAWQLDLDLAVEP